jgi:tRNA-dihydrouridine synthase
MAKLKLKSGLNIPVIQPGPMEGIMGPAFCSAINALGLTDIWITPFIRISTAVPRLGRFKHKLKYFLESNKPVIVQLLGLDPSLLADSVLCLERLGIAGINLNFACPSKTVLSNGGGGALLKTPEKMLEILSAIKQAAPDLSLSVKLRSGFESPKEMSRILELLTANIDLDFIIIHFRTVKEGYSQITDGLERLEKAVSISNGIPLIGSGDVFSVSDAQKMIEKCGCAGVSVARGWLRNPFLIRQIESKVFDKKLELPDNYKERFFGAMLDAARKDPGTCWRRSAFIEIARYLWGDDSPEFKKIINFTEEQFLMFSGDFKDI